MLIITNNGQTEPILESNYEKYEEQNGAALQISFSSFNFPENIGHVLLDPNVLVEDEDGHAYIVKQFDKTYTSKTIIANHIYYELVGHMKYDSFTGTHRFNVFADWLFAGTGWTYINENVTETLTFHVFGNGNFLQLIQRLITKFNCEMQILPRKVIRFAKIIGEDNDLQYRFKHNIQELLQSINTSKVRTRIVAYGADGLTVTYTSPLASNPKFGILDAEPVTDESMTTTTELMAFAKASLNDVPETNVDASVVEVDGAVGDYVWVIHEEMDLCYQTRILSKKITRHYTDSVVEIGNTKKRTIEDVLLEQKQEIKDNAEIAKENVDDLEEKTNEKLALLEIADEEIRLSVRNTENTLRAEISITATQIRSEVADLERDLNSSITQTASQIRLEVNDVKNNLQSSITQTASQIRLEVNDVKNNLQSSIRQTAKDIRLEVKDVKEGLETSITQTARKIRTEVKDVKNDLQSSITQTASQIRTEVSDVKKGLETSITQTAEDIRLEVKRVNDNLTRYQENYSQFTQTAEGFQQTVTENIRNIEGNVSTISSNLSNVTQTASQIQATVSSQSTEISNLGSRMWSAESSISQTAYEISSKVSYTDFTGSAIASRLTQDPYSISLIASQINLNGQVIVDGSITGNGNINISNNIRIGNAIYLGGSGMDFIDVSSGNMSFNSWGKFVFNGAIGVDVYGELRVNGKKVLTQV